LAVKTETKLADISRVAVWGSHSGIIYPDIRNAIIQERKVPEIVSTEWIEKDFIPSV
jgi:malate dehydrogenase